MRNSGLSSACQIHMQQMAPLTSLEYLAMCVAQHFFTAQALAVQARTDMFKQYGNSQKSLQPATEIVKRWSFIFWHFLNLTEEMGWIYFKTNLTASERQLENSCYYGTLMLQFHWHSSASHQKDGLIVQDAACYCLHQFFYDNSTSINQLQECYLFFGLSLYSKTRKWNWFLLTPTETKSSKLDGDILHTPIRKFARKYMCENLIGQ